MKSAAKRRNFFSAFIALALLFCASHVASANVLEISKTRAESKTDLGQNRVSGSLFYSVKRGVNYDRFEEVASESSVATKSTVRFSNGGGCFVAGTTVEVLTNVGCHAIASTTLTPEPTHLASNSTYQPTTQVPIEEIELGSLLETQNPAEPGYDPFLRFAGELVQLNLEIRRHDGTKIIAEIIRPSDQAAHIDVGDQLPIESDELEVSGLAVVTGKKVAADVAIPVTSTGRSIVTGRFETPRVTTKTRVSFVSGQEVEGTPIHPIWSVDRKEFVPLSELRLGEKVDVHSGTTEVRSVRSIETLESVYNIEASGQHVYRVGKQGLLVHNNGGPCTPVVQLNAPKTAAQTLDQRAADLVTRNGGRNRVSIKTPNGRVNIDLQGRPHGGVDTPHVVEFRDNIIPSGPRAGQVGNRSPVGPTRPATNSDLRIVDRFLKSKGQ